MKIMQFFWLGIPVLLLTSSCRKDKAITGEQLNDCDCDSTTLSFTIGTGAEFKMVYDSLGRIINYDYYTSNTKWTYSGDKISTRNNIGYWYFKDSFAYSGNDAINYYHYEGGGPVWYTNPLTLNDEGYALSYVSYSDSCTYHYTGTILDSMVNHTDQIIDKLDCSSGLLSKVVRTNFAGEFIHEIEYQYNSAGQLAMSTIIYPGGDEASTVFYYNSLGQLTETKNYFNGELSSLNTTFSQTGCCDLINHNPLNFYRYPHMKLPNIWY